MKLTNFMASIIALVAMISTSVLAQDAVSTETTEIAVVSQKGKDGADCDTNIIPFSSPIRVFMSNILVKVLSLKPELT